MADNISIRMIEKTYKPDGEYVIKRKVDGTYCLYYNGEIILDNMTKNFIKGLTTILFSVNHSIERGTM